MRGTAIALAFLMLGLVGCSHSGDGGNASSPKLASKDSKPEDPLEASRQGMHEGAFQLGNAVKDIQTALVAARSLEHSTTDANIKAALADEEGIINALDEAGSLIADYTDEPPELSEYRKVVAEQDKKRLAAIAAANDALHDVSQSGDDLDEFGDKASEADGKLLDEINEALDAATDDLTDAIKAFGGKLDQENQDAAADSGPAPDGTPPSNLNP